MRMRNWSVLALLAGGIAAAGTVALRAERQDAAPSAQQGDSPPVAVVTVAVERGDVPVIRRTIGLAEPLATVALKARLDSQLVEQRVVDGQNVAAGDVLFVLDDRELKAQIARDEAALARDDAVLDRTRADLARKRDLVAKGAATPQQVDLAVSDEAGAAAAVQADVAALDLSRARLGYATITAPIAGRVGAVQVTPGNLVKANDTVALATITQIRPIRVSFPLPERDLPAIQDARRRAEPVAVRIFLAGRTRHLASGTLDFLDSAVDVGSGTITAKANFANAETELWPGLYLDVDVEIGRVRDAAIVPTVAVQPGQDGAYVYVVKTDQTAELRRVDVAVSDGARTAIGKGLAPGDRVVIDGQARLVDGARVREAPAAANPSPRG